MQINIEWDAAWKDTKGLASCQICTQSLMKKQLGQHYASKHHGLAISLISKEFMNDVEDANFDVILSDQSDSVQ